MSSKRGRRCSQYQEATISLVMPLKVLPVMLRQPACIVLMAAPGISNNICQARFIIVDLTSIATGTDGMLNSLRRSRS